MKYRLRDPVARIVSGSGPTLAALLAALLLPLAGCDRAAGPAGERNPASPSDAGDALSLPTWKVDTASAVRIGAASAGSPEHLFSNVRHVARLSDGRIAVVDGASAEVRWFRADGTLDRRAGGRGSGPGEFELVRGAALLPGDTLVLFDPRNQRLTRLDPGGTPAGIQRLELGSPTEVALDPLDGDRLLAAVRSPQFNFGGAEYNLTRDSTFILLVASETPPDTLLRLDGGEAVTWVDYVGDRPQSTMQMGLPFAEATLVGAVEGRVVVARTGEGRVTILATDGSVIASGSPRVVEPVPISGELRERYLQHAVERAVAARAPEAMARAGAEGTLALLPAGRTLPAWDRLRIDEAAGQIWLRGFTLPWDGGPANWTILDDQGRLLARVATPAGLEVMHVGGGWVSGVTRDGLGMEYVESYRVEIVDYH